MCPHANFDVKMTWPQTTMKSVLSVLLVATLAASVPIEQTHSVMETLPAKKFMIQVRIARMSVSVCESCALSRVATGPCMTTALGAGCACAPCGTDSIASFYTVGRPSL